jgi:hypothetical protein
VGGKKELKNWRKGKRETGGGEERERGVLWKILCCWRPFF